MRFLGSGLRPKGGGDPSGPKPPHCFLRTRIPRVCEAHAVARVENLRPPPLAAARLRCKFGARSRCVCCAARADVPTPEAPPLLLFHAPRPRVFAADHKAKKATENFAANGLFFDFHDFAMKRGNVSGSGQLKFGLTGALRSTLLLAALASSPAPEPPAATFDFPWYPSMFPEQLSSGWRRR